MMLRDNNALYMQVRELCVALESLGAHELAADLCGALSISSLPGEVLGEILLGLKRIRDSSAYANWNVQIRVDAGISYVNHVLGLG